MSGLKLGIELGGKFRRGLVLEGTMWSLGIIVQSPIFNDHLSIQKGREAFPPQAFVTQFVVKTFNKAVFPRLSRRNKGRSNVLVRQPGLERFRCELAPVVGAEKSRRTAFPHHLINEGDDVFCQNGGGGQDAGTLAGELIQDAQGFEGSPIRQTVKENIVTPDVIGMLGLLRQRSGRFLLGARFAGALRLDFEAVPLPQTPCASKTDAADDRRAAAAIARIGFCSPPHLFQILGVLRGTPQRVSPHRADLQFLMGEILPVRKGGVYTIHLTLRFIPVNKTC